MDDSSTIQNTLANLDRYHWLVFVSANAVTMHSYYSDSGKIDQFKSVRIAAIGKATAQALALAGLPVDLVPESGYNSEALLAMPQMQQMKGQHCLIVRGEGGREDLATTLRNRRLAHITASIGLASRLPGESAADLITRSDSALYEAKATGRNRVCQAR